jgi:hypothetical protein
VRLNGGMGGAVASCACAAAGIAHESAAATTRQSERSNRMRRVMAATYPPDERGDIRETSRMLVQAVPLSRANLLTVAIRFRLYRNDAQFSEFRATRNPGCPETSYPANPARHQPN